MFQDIKDIFVALMLGLRCLNPLEVCSLADMGWYLYEVFSFSSGFSVDRSMFCSNPFDWKVSLV